MIRTVQIQTIFFIFSLLSIYDVSGQAYIQFKGSVTNGEQPLSDVEIRSFANRVLAVSNAKGDFSFRTVESRVYFQITGYSPLQVRVSDTFRIYLMKPLTGMLSKVVVSESKSAREIKNSTVSLELIKPELIEQTAPLSMEESINRINGVQIIDGQANIRSGSGWSRGAGSRVQLLVNGLPMLSGDAGEALWTFLPTEGIQNIEIIKGAASVVYGSAALNGVINIETKTHSVKPYTYLSSSLGFYSKPARNGLVVDNKPRPALSNLSAFHCGNIGKLDLSMGLNLLYDEGYRMNDESKRVRTTLGLRKTLPQKNMVFGLNSGIQYGLGGSFLLWDSYEHAYTALDSGRTETQSFRLNLDPYFTWNHRNNSYKITSRYLKVSNQVDNGNNSIDQSNFSDLYYGEYQYRRNIPGFKMTLISGLVTQYSHTRSPLYSGNQHSSNIAGYFQLEKKWKKVLINAGLRQERYTLNEREEIKPVFRTGLNYELGRHSFLRFSYGQGYRFPSIAETYISTSVGPVSIYPNELLESETGYNVEFGFKQGFKVKKVQAMIDFAWYEMRFNNMTEFIFSQWADPFTNSNFGIGFRSVNTGNNRIRGFENSINFEIKEKNKLLQGFLGYNYNEPRSLEPDKVFSKDFSNNELTYNNTSSNPGNKILKYRPMHSFKGDVMLEIKRFIAGSGFVYQSAMLNIDRSFIEELSLFVPGVDTAMEKNLSAYLLHNIRLGYKPFKELKINLIVSNLWNTEYLIRPGDLGPPRSLRLQISYKFDS